MPIGKPLSISVPELSGMIRKSVESTLNVSLDPDEDAIGLVFQRDPWILGFILRDLSHLSEVNIDAITKVADRIAAHVEGPTETAVLIRDGVITVGFFPEVEIDALGFGG